MLRALLEQIKSPERLPELVESLSREEIQALFDRRYPPNRRGPLSRPFAGLSMPEFNVPGVESLDGVLQAKSVGDVQKVVRYGLSNRKQVRVAGSGHSTPEAIYTANNSDLRVVLRGELQSVGIVSSDENGAVLDVGGGRYLGVNPSDPLSTPATSLNHFLDDHGYALPILGGISHQTIAGFLQTGSAGGSLSHGFADAVVEVELVDGLANVQVMTGDDLNAVAVSMGLMGVVTRVRIRVGPRYFVDGTEKNFEEEESFLVKGADGHYLLADALQKNEYLHLNWFPQHFVRRVTHWLGKRVPPDGVVIPYDSELKSELMNILAAVVLEITSILLLDPQSELAQRIVGAFLKKFVPLNLDKQFHNVWYQVLACDDEAKTDTLIKVIFTEIWLPLAQLDTAIARLTDLFNTPGGGAAGNFITELYGARQSPFWLSPSYCRDVVRVDVFWWAYSLGDPKKHFSMFWNALLDLPGARLHWGKYLPDTGVQYGNAVFNLAFLLNAYPKLGNWLQYRKAMDPQGVFLSDYWRTIFQL